MDSRLSDVQAELGILRESIRTGHWQKVEGIAAGLGRFAVPQAEEQLAAYLDDLKRTVILAKASRSVSTATLSRVRAAARFQSSSIHGSARQNFDDLTDSCRTEDLIQPLPSAT
jgi:hypothetical protein